MWSVPKKKQILFPNKTRRCWIEWTATKEHKYYGDETATYSTYKATTEYFCKGYIINNMVVKLYHVNNNY